MYNRRLLITGGILAVVLTTLFFSLFFNRFIGLRSGAGEYASGFFLVHGDLPFRDSFSTSPPLNQFKSGLLLSLFGETLIVSRTAGLIERGLIALLLYVWLLRLCRPAYATLAAFATLVISTADFVDPVASYNHDCIFLAMISGFVAGFALKRTGSIRFLVWTGFAAGVAAGLSLLTKQTIGLGATVAVPLVMAAILLRMQNLRRALAWLGAFTAGAAVPITALLLWLKRIGSLRNFLMAIFIKGPAAKTQTGAHDFVTRALNLGLVGPRPMILAICGAMIAVWLLVRSESARVERENGSSWEMPAVAIFGIVSIVLGVLLSLRHWGQAHQSWPLNMIILTEVGIIALLLLGTWQLLKGKLTERQAQVYLFAAVSFNIAFMLSLSYPLFSPMLLPGFGLIFAGALAGSNRVGRLAICGVVMLVCVDVVRLKLDIPFGFSFFAEGPVSTATVHSDQAKLRGILLPDATVRLVDGVAHIVAANTTPADTIFTYPEMVIFYALTDRKWPTLSASHNVDVVNDALAKEEAVRLLKNPPKVLVYLPKTEEQSRMEENVWRNGHRMGQRDIEAAVETLAKSYRLAGVYPTLPQNQDVYVYVRPDSPAPDGR